MLSIVREICRDGRLPKSLAELPEVPLGYKLSYDAAKGEANVVRE